MSPRRAAVGIALSCVAWLAGVAPAAAHPIVDEGRAMAHEARFEEALAAFSRAESASDLTRDDVVALLEGRALVYFALGQNAELERTLAALASLAPDHAPDRAIPPDLVARIREAGARVEAPLSLGGGAERRGTSARVHVDVLRDPTGLVRDVRVFVSDGSGGFRTLGGRDEEVVADPARTLEWYAEAVGPGGAVLTSEGTRDAPESLPPDLTPARVAADGSAGDRAGRGALGEDGAGEDDSGPGPWPFVIAGAVLAAAIGVVIAILVVPGGDTQPSAPSNPL